MKKILLASLMVCICYAADESIVPATAVVIDAIDAIVFGQAGTEVITKSDVARPSLTGQQRSRDDLIFERLVYLDAQKFKMLIPDEATIDKYLANVQRENNMTEDQLKQIFTEAGYTYEEGREQFKRLYSVNSMLEYKIRSNVIVPRNLVEEYYVQNPKIEKAAFEIQTVFVPYTSDDHAAQKKELAEKKTAAALEWSNPFWIDAEDVAEEKAFIFRMQPGQMKIEEGQEGFELFKLVNKRDERIASLEERYTEIVNILRQPKFEELMEKYRQNLFDSVSILSF